MSGRKVVQHPDGHRGGVGQRRAPQRVDSVAGTPQGGEDRRISEYQKYQKSECTPPRGIHTIHIGHREFQWLNRGHTTGRGR